MKPATTYAELMRRPNSQKRVLMIFFADHVTLPETQIFWFSDIGGDIDGSPIHWHGVIKSVPTLSWTSREITGGMPLPTWTDTGLLREDGRDISVDRSGITMGDLGKTWIVRDRKVQIWFGGEDLPFTEYQLIFSGTNGGIDRTDMGITFKLTGLENSAYRYTMANQKITTAEYPNCLQNAGKAKPVCLGFCWNVPVIQVDFAIPAIYMFNQDSNYAFIAVYVDGKVLAPGLWLDNGDGTITINAPPDGLITMAVFGAYPFDFWATQITEIQKDFANITPAQIDAASVAAANIVLPHSLGLYVPNETPVMTVISTISEKIPALWGFQKDGIFRIKKVVDPALSIPDHVINSDISSEYPIAFLDRSYTEKQDDMPTYRANLKYYENYSVVGPDRLSPLLTNSQKLSFQLPYRDDYDEDLAILADYPQAGILSGILRAYDQTSVVSVAGDWIVIKGVERYLTRMVVKMQDLSYNIGDVVQSTYKTELADGSTWYRHGVYQSNSIIFGISENATNYTITLDLWK